MSDGKMVFGIDLGTTNSCISAMQDGKLQVISIDGSNTTPSVVGRMDGQWIVGKHARNLQALYPENIVKSVKRNIGQTGHFFRLENLEFNPIELSAEILRYIKTQASLAIQSEVEDVVITVPAWFKETERQATIQAGKLAGLNVLRIVNEPTAAAIAYSTMTIRGGKELSDMPSHWVVYDLGGGTFDVSVLAVRKGYTEVLSSMGNTFLGGDDFDQKIVNWIQDQIEEVYPNTGELDTLCQARLKVAAEKAKIELSDLPYTDIQLTLDHQGKSITVDETLTRETFADLIYDLVLSTVHKMQEALDSAGIKKEQIDRLLFVGGSTRVPSVRQQIESSLGVQGDLYIDPDLSVAMGAAVQSAICEGLYFDQLVVDIAPHTLGIAVYGELDSCGLQFGNDQTSTKYRHPLTFSPLIRRNNKLPASFSKEFYLAQDGQKGIEIAIYQGESASTLDNSLVGEFVVSIPPMPKFSPVQLDFNYSLNGTVQVTVRDTIYQAFQATYEIDLSSGKGKALKKQDKTVIKEQSVENFLVSKVRKLIERVDEDEKHRINLVLGKYIECLEKKDDDELDHLEDALYEWIEERTT